MAENLSKNTSTVRPPIVAVLGHVDHGKTSLLDKIRQTRIAEREAGGITQKIGAYQIETDGHKITFIDTPGHQAFSAMRSRGAKVADIVILVVSSDDGVMPQTVESINHIKDAGVPYIVAINKIDLPHADPDRIRTQLADNGVLTESFGGDIVAVPVSAKTGEGIKELLEMILLLVEMNELKENPDLPSSGVIIESKKDRRGLVSTVIVQNGVFNNGDKITVNGKVSKIKGMFDQDGKSVDSAEAGKPVEMLGFEELPPIGLEIVKSDSSTSVTAVNGFISQMKKDQPINGNILKIIIKADSQGTLEALLASLPGEVTVVSSSVGEISEGDIFDAAANKAEIRGFNIKIPSEVEKLAETEKVVIKNYKIIYELLDDLKKRILEITEPIIKETVVGKAEIIAQFMIEGQRIAGCRVNEGKISKFDTIHLKRGDKNVADTKVSSLRHQKQEIMEAKKGEEFGLSFDVPLDFRIGDMVLSYKSS